MKKYFFLLVVVGSLNATSAFAAAVTNLQELITTASQLHESPDQVLATDYSNGSAAKISDFPTIDESRIGTRTMKVLDGVVAPETKMDDLKQSDHVMYLVPIHFGDQQSYGPAWSTRAELLKHTNADIEQRVSNAAHTINYKFVYSQSQFSTIWNPSNTPGVTIIKDYRRTADGILVAKVTVKNGAEEALAGYDFCWTK